MKQEEYKTLGILAVIFGAGALLSSRIPIINSLAFLEPTEKVIKLMAFLLY